MHNTIIIRYAEIALKGKNRAQFENRLVRNIRDCMHKNGVEFQSIVRKRGRIYINTDNTCKHLAHVFGISSFSYAQRIKYDMGRLKKAVIELLDKDFKSFRVSARRSDKSIPETSSILNIEIGQYVVETLGKKVSLTEFDVEIGIEIMDTYAYVFTEKVSGVKGLSYGINGQAYAFIENEQSLLAAWLMMKRGLRIHPIARSKIDFGLLEKFNYGYTMKLELVESLDNFDTIVLGDTIDNLTEIQPGTLVLRPLVGFSDQEIEERLNFIKDKV